MSKQSPENTTLLTPREKFETNDVVVVGDVIEDSPRDEKDVLAPKDKGKAVYWIFLIHGIGVLLSWNVLINAADYFLGYKFQPLNVTDENRTADPNAQYRENFISKLSLAAQVPNLFVNALNLVIGIGGSLRIRIVTGIIILIIVMTETLALAIVDTTSWTGGFYTITMISVVVINVAGGVYQNSLYGLAASLPSAYTNAIIIGNNICGTFIAIMNLLSRLLFPGDQRSQGICYFLIAVLVLLVTFVTYFLLPSSRFYRYYTAKSAAPAVVKSDERTLKTHIHDLVAVFKQVWVQCWNVFFVFFITLAVFPEILYNIKIVAPENSWIPGFTMEDKSLFTGIFCFLFFNMFAFFGNLLPFAVSWPGPRFVWIPILLRSLFIPFFLFCNFSREGYIRAAPVLFNDNYVYVLGVILFAFSSGYFSSLTMTYAPRSVKNPRLAPLAGQMAAFFLVFGISAGLLFGAYFPQVVLTRDVAPAAA